jgi:hypothetical protein
MIQVSKVLKIGLKCKLLYDESVNTIVCLVRVLVESRWRFNVPRSSYPVAYILGTGPSLNVDIEKITTLDLEASTFFCVNDFYKSNYFIKLKPENYIIADPDYWSDSLYKNQSKRLIDCLSIIGWPITLWIPVVAGKSIFVNEAKKAGIHCLFYNKTPLAGNNIVDSILFKLKLAMPRAQNVLVAAIGIAIWSGSKEINLFGADHDWHRDIIVSDENILMMRDHHFYDEKNSSRPFYKPNNNLLDGCLTTFTVSEIFQAWATLHKSYQQLQVLASGCGVRIFNCGSNSFIDAFKRKQLN